MARKNCTVSFRVVSVVSSALRITLLFLAIDNIPDSSATVDIDVTRSIVYGPGLEPHKIVLPARYFYIQLVNSKGENLTSLADYSSAEADLKVKVYCDEDELRQVWTQVLNRKDGSFIVRYKILLSCLKNLRIVTLLKDKNIAHSPYIIPAPVHPDSCYCPRLLSSEWLLKEANNYCSSSAENTGAYLPHPQITKDLQHFPLHSVVFDQVLNRTLTKFHHYPGGRSSHSFCHYAVLDNKVYRHCYGEHVGFHIFPDSILLSLTRKVYLPDMELLFNLGDWPLVDLKEDRDGNEPVLPIFSWCKSDSTGDILLPTYELTEASLEAMGRVSLDMMTVQSSTEAEWENKIPKLFWRGRDARRERLDLISIARKNPDLMNASLTNFFFFRDKVEEFGPREPHVSFFKFFDYKYQLNIDGTVAAYRFPFLLGGDSVVLKTASEYMEHFYGDLKPWVHYVPVKSNLDFLVETIRWLKENDEEAHKIGRNGRRYAQENLMPLNVICYHLQVFNEWAKRLKNQVRIREDMVLVEQPKPPKSTSCECTPVPVPVVSFSDGDGVKDEL